MAEGTKRLIEQQLERLMRIWDAACTSLTELIQFYEFLEEAERTFPNAWSDFLSGTCVEQNAPIFTMQYGFRNNVIICLARLYDKDQNSASIPNAADIIARQDIESHLRKSASCDFDHHIYLVHELRKRIATDYRFETARYNRDRYIAHRDLRLEPEKLTLSRHDIETLYLFTASIVESINHVLNKEPLSYTIVMNRWKIIAAKFMESIPHHDKRPATQRQPTIESHFLGTMEQFKEDFGIE